MHTSTKISLAVLASLATLTAAHAQQKTDGLWRGTGGAGLSVTSGNTDTQSLNMAVDMASATATDKITLGGGINYGKSKAGGASTTTANNWGANGQYDYNLSPQIFVFGKLGLESNKIVDLSLRATLAGGVGYKVIDTKELAFNVFGGLGYSTDKYSKKQTIGNKTDTKFSRASLMFGEESAHVLSATTSFKQRLEVYPGLSGDKAKIAKFTAGLGVAMSSTLNLTVGLTDNYNSAPAAGRKKNDLGLFTGINVKLGAN
jgi:putative salt-induced outer membrane protein